MNTALNLFGAGNFTCVDVETTGLYPEQGSRIIEVAAVKVRDFKIVNEYSSLISPSVKIPSKIIKINGITNQMLSGAPNFSQVALDFVSFLQKDLLVAHNAGFDKKFLYAEFSRLDKTVDNKFLCTIKLSKLSSIQIENYKLSTLLNHFKIFLDDKLHRALSDATGLALICINLIKMTDSQLLFKKSLV